MGIVTAVHAEAGTLSLKRADNEVVTVTRGDSTKIRRNGEEAKLSEVKVGDLVHTMQIDGGDGYQLRVIGARAPDWKPERKGHFGGRGLGGGGGSGAPPAAGAEIFLAA